MEKLELPNIPDDVAKRIRDLIAEVTSWTREEARLADAARAAAWAAARAAAWDAAWDAVVAELVSDLLPAETIAPLRVGLEAVRAHRQLAKPAETVTDDRHMMEIIAALDELSRKAQHAGNITLAVRLAEISVQERTAQLETIREEMNR